MFPCLKKRDGLLAQPGGAHWSDWRIFPAFAALCVGAGCHSSLSGAGIQQERGASNGSDGFGTWRRAWAVCGAGVWANSDCKLKTTNDMDTHRRWTLLNHLI